MRRHRSTVLSLTALLFACGVAAAQPLNDFCDQPEPISDYGLFFFDLSMATQDGVGNALCNFFGTDQIGRDVWFCWTAPEGGPVLLETCSQTTTDTKIAVYDGCACPEGLGILACNDDACGVQSRVSWNAVAGQSYLIRLGTWPGAASGGSGTFSISSALPGVLAGPFFNPANGSTYYLLNPSNWDFAQAQAVAMGGNLATIRNMDENEFLRAQVLGFDGQDRRGWIGLNDVEVEGQFVWVSGEPVVFTNWDPGEPNNNPAPENYVEMFGSNGHWNDANQNASTTRWGIVEITAGTTCAPDWDDNGQVNSTDISAFLVSWLDSTNNHNLNADFNGDGQVNSTDISAFLTAWLDAVTNGC
jgi:hypothetical protein